MKWSRGFRDKGEGKEPLNVGGKKNKSCNNENDKINFREGGNLERIEDTTTSLFFPSAGSNAEQDDVPRRFPFLFRIFGDGYFEFFPFPLDTSPLFFGKTVSNDCQFSSSTSLLENTRTESTQFPDIQVTQIHPSRLIT